MTTDGHDDDRDRLEDRELDSALRILELRKIIDRVRVALPDPVALNRAGHLLREGPTPNLAVVVDLLASAHTIRAILDEVDPGPKPSPATGAIADA